MKYAVDPCELSITDFEVTSGIPSVNVDKHE